MRNYFNYSELQQIQNVTLSNEDQHLQKVLEMFLFSCYTGITFEELKQVSKNKITEIASLKWLIIDGRKIPISLLFDGKALSILEANGYKFDLPITKINPYLSELSSALAQQTDIKIDSNLYFEMARKTFAKCLEGKSVTVAIIQNLLGHSTIEQTHRYLDSSNQ